MKILPSVSLKELDKFTIANEPIASINLMERAAIALTEAIVRRYDNSFTAVVFAGPGNNGGDGLAVARLLSQKQYKVEVYLFNIQNKLSEECSINLDRLRECGDVYFTEVINEFNPPVLTDKNIVIDAMFGSGLNKPLNGGFAAVVKYINSSKSDVIAIDIPSGLMGEDNTYNIRPNIVRADLTLSVQLPKLSFFFPENEEIVGEWETVDINLSRNFINNCDTPYRIIEEDEIKNILKPRKAFSHKGTFGHGLLIAGSFGMAGASIMASKSCLRSGIGLLTVHAPIHNLDILQMTVPEAIVDADIHERYFADAIDTNHYNAMAIGPGIGQEEDTALALMDQLKGCQCPIVLDADALNILASHINWLSQIPKRCILTPHLKELERLIGKCIDTYEVYRKTKELAAYLQAYIVIKGKWSTIVTPKGEFFINSTGNPGMATAGSGDVLTGILLSLLAQGYTQEEALKLGVYTHGLAGDIAARDKGEIGMTATDIIESLPEAWKEIQKREK